jgi:hypothetical protein
VYALGLTLLVAMISLYGAIRIARRAIARDEGTELELLGKPNWGQGNFHTNPGSVWQFVESVRNEPNLVMRTDLVAERLAEVDMETSAVATRIGMWARVALYFGAAATVVSVGKVFGRPMDLETFAAFGPFLLGAATAALCIGIGRWANARASRRRWAWDRLSAARLRPLLAEQISASEPPGSRRGEEKRSCPSGA